MFGAYLKKTKQQSSLAHFPKPTCCLKEHLPGFHNIYRVHHHACDQASCGSCKRVPNRVCFIQLQELRPRFLSFPKTSWIEEIKEIPTRDDKPWRPLRLPTRWLSWVKTRARTSPCLGKAPEIRQSLQYDNRSETRFWPSWVSFLVKNPRHCVWEEVK